MSREPATVRNASKWLVIFATVLVVVSFFPLTWKVRIGTHGPLHLKLHFAAFAVFGLLAYASANDLPSRVIRATALVLVAAFLEMMQWLVFGNDFELIDLKVDAAGALVALFLSQSLSVAKRLTSRQ